MMMPSNPIGRELNKHVNKDVLVELKDGRRLSGVLKAVDPSTMSVIVKLHREDEYYPLVVLNGSEIRAIYLKTVKFDLAELKKRLDRVFPRTVEYRPAEKVIIVMNRIRVTENGVEGERGPVYERVKNVFDEYLRELKQSQT